MKLFAIFLPRGNVHPDVQVLVEFRSVKYIHNVSDVVSQDGNSELHA